MQFDKLYILERTIVSSDLASVKMPKTDFLNSGCEVNPKKCIADSESEDEEDDSVLIKED